MEAEESTSGGGDWTEEGVFLGEKIKVEAGGGDSMMGRRVEVDFGERTGGSSNETSTISEWVTGIDLEPFVSSNLFGCNGGRLWEDEKWFGTWPGAKEEKGR